MSSMSSRGREPLAPRRRGVRRGLWVALVLVALLALDWQRAPRAQWTNRALVAAVRGYQATLSPRIARLGARCRFRPTCSHYAVAVLERDGALLGGLETAWRLLRCGPWTPAETLDPP